MQLALRFDAVPETGCAFPRCTCWPCCEAPSQLRPDPSRARDEVTERSQDEAGGEQLKADTAKS